MPSAEELRTLAKFVRARHPAFGPHERQDEDDYAREFAAAFRALGYSQPHRGAGHEEGAVALDRRRRVWLRARNLDERLTAAPFLAAAIAHGDISWSSDRSLGLAEGSGRPCTNRWHAVLQGGELLPPLPMPNAAPARPPQHMGLRPSDEPIAPVVSTASILGDCDGDALSGEFVLQPDDPLSRAGPLSWSASPPDDAVAPLTPATASCWSRAMTLMS